MIMQYAVGLLCVGLFAALWGAHLIGRKIPEPVKPKPVKPELAEPVRRQITSQPVGMAVEIEGRGAAAILLRSQRAAEYAISKPPPEHNFCVVRQEDRRLAVVIRKNNRPATDRIIKLFGADNGAEAWTHRDELEYGRAA